MIHLKLAIVFVMVVSCTAAQKPALDTSVLKGRNWFSIGISGISPEGDYLFYKINGNNTGNLVVRSVKGEWEKRFIGISPKGFSSDNTTFVYQSKDSVCFLTLGSNKMQCISGVKELRLTPTKYIDWIALQFTGDRTNALDVRQVTTAKSLNFSGVSEYAFSGTGQSILTKEIDEAGRQILKIVDFTKSGPKLIWQSSGQEEVSSYKFDRRREQLAFVVKSAGGFSIWHYQPGMEYAEKKVDNETAGLVKGWRPDGKLIDFTESGQCLLFNLVKDEEIQIEPGAVNIDLWSYWDKLPPHQSLTVTCQASVAISNGRIVNLVNDNGQLVKVIGDIAVIKTFGSSTTPWVQKDKNTYSYVSLSSDRKGFLGMGDWDVSISEMRSSPDGQFLTYYDYKARRYYSYDLSSGKALKMSKDYYCDIKRNLVNPYPGPENLGWLEDGRMLTRDRYDIWALDPLGKKSENLTNGYGRLHKIAFSPIMDSWDRFEAAKGKMRLSSDTILYLSAFDETTKCYGHYEIVLGRKAKPTQLNLGPYYLRTAPNLKAQGNNWLFLKESPGRFRNLFITHDLKKFIQITNLQPQEKFNWMTAEVFHYKQTDGVPTDATLFKPEDFDPKRKYPVVFLYYQRLTDDDLLGTYHFQDPMLFSSTINIPYFVSRGYLVCTPDIQYTDGQPGRSACASVEGAALYLKKFPFVDGNKMGINGHSFGGYESNYIVTHSKLFKAVCTASGFSDLMSWYGSSWGNYAALGYTEISQAAMFGTPWEIKQKYLDNSPVWHSDKVGTPMLMMANKKDEVVYQQNIEFFLCLRRLSKKAWLLQYDDGEHSLQGQSALDYTIRVTQFFDHYLKGAPAPKWMVEGLPQRYKGKRSHFQLEAAGVEPQ